MQDKTRMTNMSMFKVFIWACLVLVCATAAMWMWTYFVGRDHDVTSGSDAMWRSAVLECNVEKMNRVLEMNNVDVDAPIHFPGLSIDAMLDLGTPASPLIICASKGELDAVRLLLDRGADPNMQEPNGNAAIHFAINTPYYSDNPRYVDIVRMLVDHGADIELVGQYNWPPLAMACALCEADGYEEVVQILIHADVDLDKPRQDSLGVTPLMYASMNGCIMVVNALLSASVDIHAVDERGENALMYAVSSKSVNLVELLVEAGSDLEQQDQRGFTVLHHAAQLGDDAVDVIRYLLRLGADPNQRARDGATAVHEVARQLGGLASSINLAMRELIDSCGDPMLEDSKGHTAIILLEAGGNLEEAAQVREWLMIKHNRK